MVRNDQVSGDLKKTCSEPRKVSGLGAYDLASVDRDLVWKEELVHVLHGRGKFVHAVWLRHDTAEAMLLIVGQNRVVCVTTCHNGFDIGIDLL